jgi:hypothetical protein
MHTGPGYPDSPRNPDLPASNAKLVVSKTRSSDRAPVPREPLSGQSVQADCSVPGRELARTSEAQVHLDACLVTLPTHSCCPQESRLRSLPVKRTCASAFPHRVSPGQLLRRETNIAAGEAKNKQGACHGCVACCRGPSCTEALRLATLHASSIVTPHTWPASMVVATMFMTSTCGNRNAGGCHTLARASIRLVRSAGWRQSLCNGAGSVVCRQSCLVFALRCCSGNLGSARRGKVSFRKR